MISCAACDACCRMEEDLKWQESLQVYGSQPRWKKYAKRALQRSPDARFDEVVEKLTELTQQAWTLQTNTNTAASRCNCSPVHERYPAFGLARARL